MKNLVLIGMMGCGKSTCGRLLAAALHRDLVDTDALIVKREGRSINEIFADSGEEYFRDRETEIARELSRQGGLVIATGGGLPLREENRALLRENGCVVFLDRPPREIFRSVSMAGRPLGRGGEEQFLKTYALRRPIYCACAHMAVASGKTPEATVRTILGMLPDDFATE